MFLKEIHLINFKCFADAEFHFPNRLTVFIGDNGSGKSAVMDGVARALKNVVDDLYLNGKNNDMQFQDNQIRVVSHKFGSKSSLEKQSPYGLECVIETIDNKLIEWHFTNQGGNFSEINTFFNNIRRNVISGGNATLPLIVYYRSNRYWSSEKVNVDLYPVGSRLDTYKDCLNPITSSKVLLDWFKRMALIQFQRNAQIPELVAVREAMLKALSRLKESDLDIIDLYYSAENDELMINTGIGGELPFRLLSDGYRNTLGMIGDIAFRMAELNPHLTNNSPGVVLIDEIDIHLHPKWQKTIIQDLKSIFPNCQFLVTTHSPFIIQSLDQDDSLIQMTTREDQAGDYINESLEDIAEAIQGVENPQWSRKREKMFDAAAEYYQALQEIEGEKSPEEIQRLKNELDNLIIPFEDNPAYAALLEQERIVREAKLNKN